MASTTHSTGNPCPITRLERQSDGSWLLAFGSERLDPFAVWGRMVRRGWFSGLTSEPRGIHLMLSPAHAKVADQYLADLAASVDEVLASGEKAGDTRARYA